MKNSILFIIILGILKHTLFAQGYQLEFEAPNDFGLGFPTSFYNTDFNWSIDRLDLEGDGVLELVTLNRNNDFLRVYDGATHQLKWEYALSQNEGADIFVGFYDIDGDQVREAVFNDDGSSDGRIRIVDVQTNMIEFSLNGGYYFTTIIDIDNDTYPELIVEDGTNDRAQIWGSGTVSSIESNTNSLRSSPKLSQNYPNPFNPSTIISYSVQQSGKVQIKIYDNLGKIVRLLVDESKSVGEYSITWDGKNDSGNQLSSGTYFYQLHAGDYTSTKKMLLIK